MGHDRPRGLSLPRVMFALGVFTALALVALIARAEPRSDGERQRLELRAQTSDAELERRAGLARE